MKKLLYSLAASACFLAVLHAGDDENLLDRRRLQGTWIAVSLEEKGKPLAKDELRQRGLKLTFTGEKIVLADKGALLKGTFRVEAERKPRGLDWKFLLEGGEMSVTLAIYEVKEDTLTICWNSAGAKNRPGDFKTTAKGRTTLAVFQRQQ